jgi:hypothetical protein
MTTWQRGNVANVTVCAGRAVCLLCVVVHAMRTLQLIVFCHAAGSMQRALHKLTFTCGVRSGLDLSEHASVCGMISTVRGCAGVLAIAEASTVSTDACIIRARTRRRRLETLFLAILRNFPTRVGVATERQRGSGADAVLDGWCQGCSCNHGRCTNLHAL